MPRFMRKGNTKVYFRPGVDIVNYAAISVGTEMGTAINLTPQLGEMNGFTFANSPIQTPDMDNAYTSQIGGEDTAAESSMGLYEIRTDADTIRAALTKDLAGTVIIFPTGLAGATPAVGDDYEAWPCVITSNARTYTVGNEAAMYNVSFSITDPPVEGTLAA